MRSFLRWALGWDDYVNSKMRDMEIDHQVDRQRFIDGIETRDRALARLERELQNLRSLRNAMVVNNGGRVVISPATMDAGIDSTVVIKTTPDGVEYTVVKGSPKWAR